MSEPKSASHETELAGGSPGRDAVWMAELVDASVTELLRSYARTGGLNNRDAHNMPSKRAVGQICEDLLQITLFILGLAATISSAFTPNLYAKF